MKRNIGVFRRQRRICLRRNQKRPYRRLIFEPIQNRPFDSLPQYKKNQPDEMNTMNKVNVEEM